MAFPADPFDLDNETLAQFLAKAIDDGTFADVISTASEDRRPVRASRSHKRFGANVADTLKSWLETTYPIHHKARKTWKAADDTARDALGTDDGLAVEDLCSVDGGTVYRCLTAAASSSTWTASTATGPTTITRIDIGLLSGVQGAWDMEDDTLDRGPHGLDLTGGTTYYATIQGKRCGHRGTGVSLSRPSNDPELTITGALTVHQLVYGTPPVSSHNHALFAFSGPGGSEPDNYLYMVWIQSGGAGEHLVGFTENGAGSTNSENFLINHVPGSWTLYTYTQDAAGTEVNLYINGILAGASPLSQPAPTGGSTARFAMYAPNIANSGFEGYVGDTVIQDVEMTPAEILAVAQQVGVA